MPDLRSDEQLVAAYLAGEKTALIPEGEIPPGLLVAQEKLGLGEGKGQGRENSREGKGTDNALDQIARNIQKHIGVITLTTYFYYDGAGCIEERNVSDSVVAQYVFGNAIDEVLQAEFPLASTQHPVTGTFYYHDNSLGSIFAITNGTGNVVERYSYTVYGKVTITDAQGNPYPTSQISNRFMFTGREYDVESGLYYYRARYYSPELGRFLQRDQASRGSSRSNLNPYEYCVSNPINYVDPSGWNAEPKKKTDSDLIDDALKILKKVATKWADSDEGKRVNETLQKWHKGCDIGFGILPEGVGGQTRTTHFIIRWSKQITINKIFKGNSFTTAIILAHEGKHAAFSDNASAMKAAIKEWEEIMKIINQEKIQDAEGLAKEVACYLNETKVYNELKDKIPSEEKQDPVKGTVMAIKETLSDLLQQPNGLEKVKKWIISAYKGSKPKYEPGSDKSKTGLKKDP